MGYSHKGRILDNGECVFGPEPVSAAELTVIPEDDGLHIVDFNIGDFEWWYFDILDRTSDYFLKIVLHIGTDPLRTRIFPQLAISVNTPEMNEEFMQPYTLGELEADTEQCTISIKNEAKIWAGFNTNPVYFINIDIPGFKCNFEFTGAIEGWKPLGNEILQQLGKKKGSFSWIIQMPLAKVEGDFTVDGKPYNLHNASGYHDHNYIKVDKRRPLYLDELITRWFWGKCTIEKITVIFMDTWCRTNRILSLMVAESDRIIYSANNMLDCKILSVDYDRLLKVNYPSKLRIQSRDEQFRFRADFDLIRVSDRRDLLEGVNPVLQFLIKKLVVRPAYHGIIASVKMSIGDSELEGTGNFESMFFRDKCRITSAS